MSTESNLRVSEDDMDLKTFMEAHDIGVWPTEHERLAHIFTQSGLVVFRVERTSYCWGFQLLKPTGVQVNNEQLRPHLRKLLRGAEVRVDCEEPFIVPEGRRLSIYFDAPGGQIGLGLRLAETRRGSIVPCRREYALPPYECHPHEKVVL